MTYDAAALASPQPATALPIGPVDLLVVGAGVVGLAHAVEAHLPRSVRRRRRARRPSRSAPRSATSATSARRPSRTSPRLRPRWPASAGSPWLAKAGSPLLECGTVVVARAAGRAGRARGVRRATRGTEQVRLLDRRRGRRPRCRPTTRRSSVAPTCPWTCAPTPARPSRPSPPGSPSRASRSPGARSARQFEPGRRAHQPRRPVRAGQVVVAVGHDVDRLFPEVADAVGLRALPSADARRSTPRPAPRIEPGRPHRPVDAPLRRALAAMPRRRRVRAVEVTADRRSARRRA